MSPYDVVFEHTSFLEIRDDYIDNLKVNYIHYMIPYSGLSDETSYLYLASICSSDSNNYIEFSHALYNKTREYLQDINNYNLNPESEFINRFSKSNIIDIAKSYGLDINNCIENSSTKDECDYHIAFANSLFIDKIPTFYIKNQIFEGIIKKEDFDVILTSN